MVLLAIGRCQAKCRNQREVAPAVSHSVVTEPQSPRVPLQLYDLMTMAFKYQVLLCPRPKDILLVTFNHLDTIKDFIHDSPSILNQVDETFRQLIEVRACRKMVGNTVA